MKYIDREITRISKGMFENRKRGYIEGERRDSEIKMERVKWREIDREIGLWRERREDIGRDKDRKRARCRGKSKRDR